MPTVGTYYPTLQDWASRAKDGKIQSIIEILHQQKPMVKDMAVLEGNLPTGHLTVIRSGLPAATWRQLNYGVPRSKSKTVQVTDSIGMLEQYSDVDKFLADLSGDVAAFRLSEDRAHLEAMNQTMESTMIYGNTATDPKKFMGLSPRYNSLSAENAENVIDAGGTGSDNSSIWLVTWGPDTCHAIFPNGQPGGLEHIDKGNVTLEDANGNLYEGYRAFFKWHMGLTLKDWRYVVRIANIDISLLIADGGVVSSGADLIVSMIKAANLIPEGAIGRQVFYVNKTVYTYLDLQTLKQTNMNVSYGEDQYGKKVMTFRGVPVRKTDALLETEARVT